MYDSPPVRLMPNQQMLCTQCTLQPSSNTWILWPHWNQTAHGHLWLPVDLGLPCSWEALNSIQAVLYVPSSKDITIACVCMCVRIQNHCAFTMNAPIWIWSVSPLSLVYAEECVHLQPSANSPQGEALQSAALKCLSWCCYVCNEMLLNPSWSIHKTLADNHTESDVSANNGCLVFAVYICTCKC